MQYFLGDNEINITKEEDLNNQHSLEDKEAVINRIKEIKKSISGLHSELEDLVSKCNHSDGYIVKLLNDRFGNNSGLRKVCKICDSAIGYPSQEETNEWRKN
jgi:hypothetical protein